MLEVIAVAVWTMLPAYVPNNVAVVAGGGPPIDGGLTWRGERLLGDGKTWRGTIAGTLAGVVVALALNAVHDPAVVLSGVAVPQFTAVAALTLSAGAMLGDILASFLKRRTGRRRGTAFPLVDQLDFVVVALALTLVFATDWLLATVTFPVLAVILVLTPLLHVVTNVAAYLLGLKAEPY